jgi:hypothetical protein
MLPTSAASINCRAALILPLAALGLSTVLAVLAVLPGIDWGHLVRVAPLSLAQPGWVSMAGAAAVVCGLGVAIATANRSREGGPR